ncbi:MAG: hypothetical protein IPJ76_01480 [Flavobacteriales bacterium]|nr:MAG: hypothetical protein IPJ76_01480 [Flavobacteriales bacterium]
MSKQETDTDERLDEAYIVMAGIIRNGGDKYLPIFKRLHEEREVRRARKALKQIALQVASDMVL